jgi:uncharacterized membrane protein
MSSFVASVIGFALLVVLALRTPAFAPPGVFFGVTVPADFARTEAGRDALRRYRLVLVAYVAAGLAVMLVGGARRASALEALASFVVVAGLLHGYLVARRGVQPFAVAPDGTRAARIGPRVSPSNLVAWQLPAWVLIGAAAAWLTRLRAAGSAAATSSAGAVAAEATHPSHASPLLAYVPLATGALTLSLLLVTGWLLTTRARKGTSSNWAASRVALIGSAYLVALSSAAVALAPVLGATPVLATSALSLPLVVAVVLVASRRGGAEDVRSLAPDLCWKWGLFYVNPNDAALLVPKRFGIGYSLNFAHPAASILCGVVALFVVAALALGGGH